MRKIRRAVLRNEANRLSHYGQNGKSIAIFRSLWADYKELKRHKAAEATENGLLAQIKAIRKKKAESGCKSMTTVKSPYGTGIP